MSVEFKYLQEASGHFLTEYLPDNWEDMSDDDQDKWLESHAWEPLENFSVDDVWNVIDSAARSIKSFTVREMIKEGIDMCDENLTCVNLRGLHLTNLNFEGSDLRNCNLDGELYDVSFQTADLSGANLSGSTIYECHLGEADFARVNLKGCSIINCHTHATDFTKANMKGVMFESKAFDVDFTGADLSGATFQDCNLEDCIFVGANLTGANLTDAKFEGTVDFTGANLTDAKLTGALMAPIAFGDCDLESADLSGIKADFFSRLRYAKDEAPELLKALKNGEVNGRVYQGDCACFVGTVAKIRGVNYEQMDYLKPDYSSPTERWFMGIHAGHTPETNQIAAITARWIQEFIDGGEA